ncbi:MAG: CehA/McbA family metallohydrolase [Candidatus Nanoarchaeia archaeon]|nr:CehA/McbA family metallohydrolase [Candidatus Nanoarchaeia archaeon]MDD5239285.1 CehA/McbA family metallohydrolase [Candidatus Nanoarchaeia archaeon]
MNVLKGDFHTHTKYSIEPKFGLIFEIRALHGPERLIKTAIKRGLTSLAITDHDNIRGAEIGEQYIKKHKIENFTLLKGEEVSTNKGHMIGVGLEEPIKPGRSPQETADKIKAQGGAVIVPHPYTHYGIKEYTVTTKGIDAIEVFNTFYWFNSMQKLRTNFYPKFAERHHLGQVAGTDAHTLGIIGKVYTKIKSEHGVDNVVKAVKQHNTECAQYTTFLRSVRAVLKTAGLFPLFWRPKPKIKKA